MKIFGLFFLLLMFFTISNAQQLTWEKQNVETKASLRGLSVVNQNVVWASGTGGTVLRTVDGGKNWSVIKVPDAEKLDFRDIEAFDENTAYVVSIGNGDASRIYKTTDGGKSWKLQFKNTNEKAFFDAIAFWDKKHGIAMSDPVDGKYVLMTTSDGETWQPLDTSKMPAAKEGEAAFAASGTCLITQGKSNVFLVSGGTDARVFRSTNRGKTWKVYDTPMVKGTAGSGIFSIAMFDSKNGIIVGGNYEKPDEKANNLAVTWNGGKLWASGTLMGTSLNGYRSGVAFVERDIIFAVGASGSDVSTNGGRTWTNIDKGNYNAVGSKNNVIWAVGANGLVVKTYYASVLITKSRKNSDAVRLV